MRSISGGKLAFAALVATVLGSTTHVHASGDTAAQIVQKMLESDPWGLSGAVVTARATIKDDGGSKREIVFHSESRRYDGTLTKSLVRVSTPADLAGVGLLQVQKRSGDDERFLFLPELSRARRVAGNARHGSFVGTDFSYADIDRRDLRNAKARLVGEEKLGPYDVFHLDLTPTNDDAEYPRVEVWVRKDGYVPLKAVMYAKSGAVKKLLTTVEIKRLAGHWFITSSHMENKIDHRTTDLVLEQVTPSDSVPDDEFTVRNLEKL